MKGLIVLQRRFAPIGHAIALELKNEYGVGNFCGYVITRRALMITRLQKDIEYTDLVLDEEFHNKYKEEKLNIGYLKRLEAEYGMPNLWPCIALDRTLMMNVPKKEYAISPAPPYSHEEMLRVLQCYFRDITAFLEKERPDFIVGISVGSIGVMILRMVAQKMSVKFYTIENGKVGNRITFSDNYLTLSGVEKIFKDIRVGNYKSPNQSEAENFLKNFRDNPAPPSFAVEDKKKSLFKKTLSVPGKLWQAVAFTIRSFMLYIKNPYKSDTTTENPFSALFNKTRRKLRSLRNLKRFYETPVDGEEFAYFPLHFEPEVTTLLYSPFYTNQINLLTQIAKSLPVHFKLYVKEHPAMLEYRPTNYYRELKKIPNLKLLDPRTSSFDLIKSCKLVATISGTAGFEASMLRKPVVTFGDIFYNNLSFVKRCRAIEDAPYIIKEQLDNFKYDDQEMRDFLSALFEDTTPCDLVNAWGIGTDEEIKKMMADPEFKKFIASLAQKIGIDKIGN